MIDVFDFLLKLIKEKCPWVRFADMYNDQMGNIDNEIEMDLPAVFIEFGPIAWRTVGPNTQQGDTVIRFHLCQVTTADSYSGSGNYSMAIALMKNYYKLHVALQGARSQQMTSLDRSGQIQDEVYGELNVMILEYATTITEVIFDQSSEILVQAELNEIGQMDIEQDGVNQRPSIPPDTNYII
jgi:hypothetical protein